MSSSGRVWQLVQQLHGDMIAAIFCASFCYEAHARSRSLPSNCLQQRVQSARWSVWLVHACVVLGELLCRTLPDLQWLDLHGNACGAENSPVRPYRSLTLSRCAPAASESGPRLQEHW
jgi:hypothetical protein